MYNYIVFDIDGTILDTEIAVLSSLQKLVHEELSKDLSFNELRFALGIPGEAALNKLISTRYGQFSDFLTLSLKIRLIDD